MTRYQEVQRDLLDNPKTWLITGVAGFIGSNLLQTLLMLDQNIVGLDNFDSGHRHNLYRVKDSLTKQQWDHFTFIEGDIGNRQDCLHAVKHVNFVLHHAGISSVPQSVTNPLRINEANITGFLNVLDASKDQQVESFTYASSSSVYGNQPIRPLQEENQYNPISPYAASKCANELYAHAYAQTYGFNSIGLRYFNVFGHHQAHDADQAAVIPKWVAAMIEQNEVIIYGDGETSRDFCFVQDAVQMSILAATAPQSAKNHIYNVASGKCTTLNELYQAIKSALLQHGVSVDQSPIYRRSQPGDVRHSQADIRKAKDCLGYTPSHELDTALAKTIAWYLNLLSIG